MENTKKLWIVSEFFYPEETATSYYLTEIAKYLSLDREINVICSDVSYEKQSKIKEKVPQLSDKIKVLRVSTFALNKNSFFQRIIRLTILTFVLGYHLVTKVNKNDRVWLVTNPAFLVPFAILISKIKKFHLSILAHDVFPENLLPTKIISSNNLIYKFAKKIFDKTYEKADRVIVCGRDMATLIAKKVNREAVTDNKIIVIENWADVEDIYPSNESVNVYENLNLDGKIIFQFAGNIGRLQGLENLLTIVEQCRNPLIHFVLIGEGALKAELQKIVDRKKLNNVSFLGSFKRSQQNVFLNACDVGIVSLYDSMLGLGVPSKSYNIMAAGKPILFLGNKESEIALMVNEYDIGWVFEFSDFDKIIDFFNNFKKEQFVNKGKKSRSVAENYYSKKVIMEKYHALLD